MKVLDAYIKRTIKRNLVTPICLGDYETAVTSIPEILDYLYSQIPQKRRISFGRVHTIRVLSEYLYTQFSKEITSVYQMASRLYEISQEPRSKGVALGILSYQGLTNFHKTLPYFSEAAASDEWEIREFAQMFFRKLIQKYPTELRPFLLTSVKSEDANVRRFVAETLRPVQENKWIYSNPEYSLSILRHLFTETETYPRTAVGNNLSDLARRLPNRILDLVEKLVQSNDKNSFWIAYRACRNLVKKEPLKVMDFLSIDKYRYKKRVYTRQDFVKEK